MSLLNATALLVDSPIHFKCAYICTKMKSPNVTTNNCFGPKTMENVLTDNYNKQNNTNDSHYDHHLDIRPPMFPLQLPCLLFKLRCTVLQGVRPFVQLGKFLITFQDFLHINFHDTNDFIDLCLRLLETFLREAGLRLRAIRRWR